MKKILFTLLAVLMSHLLTAQTQIFQFEEGENYCTIEIDTTLAVDWGTFRAKEFMNVPYYEMTFTPSFEVGESGENYLVITPTWHYYAYLAKIYGETENADTNSYQFRLKYKISADEQTLTFISTEAEQRVVHYRSSFTKKKHINFVGMPKVMTKAEKVDLNKFPKDLRKNLEKRINKIKSRLSN